MSAGLNGPGLTNFDGPRAGPGRAEKSTGRVLNIRPVHVQGSNSGTLIRLSLSLMVVDIPKSHLAAASVTPFFF